MEIQSFDKKPAYFEDQKISIEEIVNGKDSKIPLSFDHLSFIFSLYPTQLDLEGNSIFVPERSVIKLPPGSDASLTFGKGKPAYILGFHRNEMGYLSELKKDPFFETLKGNDQEEWNKVKDESLDFVLPTERNSEHILHIGKKALIAPPYSRMNAASGVGWNLMYSRGSRALGVASDVLFRVRANEVYHAHRLTQEFYVTLEGIALLSCDGSDQYLQPKQVLLTSPGEKHAIKLVVNTPYMGLTLNHPSIPGDRIFS